MTTYYVKNGRRYRAVAESDAFGAIPEGWWLVHVFPGGLSSRKSVTPDRPAVEAAIREAEDAMVEAMLKRCEPTGPGVRHVPEKDRPRYLRAWEAWKKIVGDVPMYFEGVSMHDVVDAGIAALRAKILANPPPPMAKFLALPVDAEQERSIEALLRNKKGPTPKRRALKHVKGGKT